MAESNNLCLCDNTRCCTPHCECTNECPCKGGTVCACKHSWTDPDSYKRIINFIKNDEDFIRFLNSQQSE